MTRVLFGNNFFPNTLRDRASLNSPDKERATHTQEHHQWNCLVRNLWPAVYLCFETGQSVCVHDLVLSFVPSGYPGTTRFTITVMSVWASKGITCIKDFSRQRLTKRGKHGETTDLSGAFISEEWSPTLGGKGCDKIPNAISFFRVVVDCALVRWRRVGRSSHIQRVKSFHSQDERCSHSSVIMQENVICAPNEGRHL